MSIAINVDSIVGVGASRIAYDGVVQAASQQHPFHPGDRVVVKVLRGEFYNTGYRLSQLDFSCQARADALAQEFTARRQLRIADHVVAVLFQGTYLWEFSSQVAKRDGTIIIAQGEFGLVEKKLDLPFQKFNSNTGWTAGNPIADCFSHWTYWVTQCTELVCDLQGNESHGGAPLVFRQSAYTDYLFLTDPAISSVERKWGPSDLGPQGIEQWFSGHQCSQLCVGLGLQQCRPKSSVQVGPIVRETSYVDSHTNRQCAIQ